MTIYFDMDGVLTDFVKKCETENCFKKNGKANWDKIDALGPAFWTEMEWLPGSQTIFEAVSDFAKRVGWKVKILSAIHSTQGKEGKIEWCQRNLGLSKSNIDIVQKKAHKYSRANPQSLLIDNTQEIINSFLYSGGMAIQYDGKPGSIRKIEFFLDSLADLEKEGNLAALSEPTEIIKARMKYLLKRLNYNDCDAEFQSYLDSLILNFYSDFMCVTSGKKIEGLSQIDPHFHSLRNFLSQEFLDRVKENKKYEEMHGLEYFPGFMFPSPWETKLQKEHLQKEISSSIFKKKDNIIAQTVEHIKLEQNLFSFYALPREDATAVLSFVYLNLLIELLQNEISTAALSV